ncbi:MAG: class I SAM-dependent methyltransferase, partial [Chloroflexota bacterium]
MRLNPLDHPIIFTNPEHLTTSSWTQHLPFGMFMIDLLKPRILVELGTHYGVSYCGFCQAVKTLRTDSWCYAVDSWKGDEHTGAYEAQVYEELRQYHDARYGDFSQLLKMNFDDALPYFADRSIDLLHIDGYHTYEAVRHDFETWLPKLSDRAVVLIHDVNERDRQFGVWRYWDELKSRYPSFEMLHEHGLGVAAIGGQIPQALGFLLDAAPEERAQIREFFYQVGARISLQMQEEEFVSRLQHVENL